MNTPQRIAAYASLAVTPLAAADIYTMSGSVIEQIDDGSTDFVIAGGSFGAILNISIAAFQTSYYNGSTYGSTFSSQNDFTFMAGGGASIQFNGALAAGQSVRDLAFGSQNEAMLFYKTWGSFYTGGNGGSGGSSWGQSSGNWNPSSPRNFLGFQLTQNGETVYGWLDIGVQEWTYFDTASITVYGWAFDDSGDGILAGEIPAPGALGLLGLAAGASGIRRKRHTA